VNGVLKLPTVVGVVVKDITIPVQLALWDLQADREAVVAMVAVQYHMQVVQPLNLPVLPVVMEIQVDPAINSLLVVIQEAPAAVEQVQPAAMTVVTEAEQPAV
jgi:hypothetical protein